MTRREHIEKLVKQYGATVEYTAERYGMAVDTIDRILFLAPWDEVPEEEVYWVALHELGHLALTIEEDEAHHRRPRLLFGFITGTASWAAEREARAWVWALDHADRALEQAAESAMAWGIADRLHPDSYIGEGLRRIHSELGDDPDWFFNVTEPEHFAKLDGYARPRWSELSARIAEDSRASCASGAHQNVRCGARLP